MAGAFLQQREIADVLMGYLPAMDAARGAGRACQAWHKAMGREHGRMLALVEECIKQDRVLMICDSQGQERQAIRLWRGVIEPHVAGGIVVHGVIVNFLLLLQRQPSLIRATVTTAGEVAYMAPHRPFWNATEEELAVEKVFYVLTGIHASIC
jgi:hypothetical protein